MITTARGGGRKKSYSSTKAPLSCIEKLLALMEKDLRACIGISWGERRHSAERHETKAPLWSDYARKCDRYRIWWSKGPFWFDWDITKKDKLERRKATRILDLRNQQMEWDCKRNLECWQTGGRRAFQALAEAYSLCQRDSLRNFTLVCLLSFYLNTKLCQWKLLAQKCASWIVHPAAIFVPKTDKEKPQWRIHMYGGCIDPRRPLHQAFHEERSCGFVVEEHNLNIGEWSGFQLIAVPRNRKKM